MTTQAIEQAAGMGVRFHRACAAVHVAGWIGFQYAATAPVRNALAWAFACGALAALHLVRSAVLERVARP